MTSAVQSHSASDVVLAGLRRGLRPTSYPSGCLGTRRTAACLLAASSSPSTAMTPCQAALWGQQHYLATPASYRASGSGFFLVMCVGQQRSTGFIVTDFILLIYVGQLRLT
ncbi:uncharacterized protein LOC142566844 isoform X2 [Dermacentor variabilis]|uniref:uncharacterized protein LOC142566844 isoform X2 n=1 Tax=Dermacentor variabilis TaxID=34621 RepID=UPI003F5C30B3